MARLEPFITHDGADVYHIGRDVKVEVLGDSKGQKLSLNDALTQVEVGVNGLVTTLVKQSTILKKLTPLADVAKADFSKPGMVFQIGLPPARIDVLTALTGLNFDEAWSGGVRAPFGPVTVDVIGRDAFIKNKRATGRAKDLGDLDALGE